MTRARLLGQAWRRLFPDVYVAASVPDDHALRARAAALKLPPGAVISARSAAHLWGAELATASDPVDILTPRDMRSGHGLNVRHGLIAPDEVALLDRVPLPTPVHTAWEVARTIPLDEAVAWIDALARRCTLSSEELCRHAERHRGESGSRRAAKALALCDPRAESPPESRLRVALVDRGLPKPIPQWAIIIAGRFVARVDLAWPRWRFAVEYDGAWHAAPAQLARDRRRLRALNAAGWYVYHVTAVDMRDVDALVGDIAATLARLARR